MELENASGLIVATYAPVTVKHTLSNGQSVTLDMKTDYPFQDTATIDVWCDAGMELSLVIPSWADGATVSVNRSSAQSVSSGTLMKVSLS